MDWAKVNALASEPAKEIVNPRVLAMAQAILKHEGAYVDNPDDKGGATNFGITIHTLKRLGIDLDADGDVDKADVKLITPQLAVSIFVEQYYFAPGLDQLPSSQVGVKFDLQDSVFDMAVNAGQGNAIKLLQRVINSEEGCDRIKVDGGLGPRTLQYCKTHYDADPAGFSDEYGKARRAYYMDIGRRRPSQRQFVVNKRGGKGGWIRRSEDFISPAQHWSLQRFRDEVAKW